MSYNRRGYPKVFTDGACSNNGQQGASAGTGVYWGPNHPMNVSEPVRGRQTNNTAEIQAATRAINQAKSSGYSGVNIRTDSRFLIQGATEWTQSWERNNWHRSNGEPVKNASDFQDLARAQRGIDVEWTHTRGHSGDHGNDAADRLARDACSRDYRRR